MERIRGACFRPTPVTFERLIELVFPEHDPQVVNSTRVKLHPEYHVSARAAVALVVALELEGEKKHEETI